MSPRIRLWALGMFCSWLRILTFRARGNGSEMEIIGLAKTVLELTGSDSEIEFQSLPPDDAKRRCPDASKAERLLKWKAETKSEGRAR